jgi:hypothetical protein
VGSYWEIVGEHHAQTRLQVPSHFTKLPLREIRRAPTAYIPSTKIFLGTIKDAPLNVGDDYISHIPVIVRGLTFPSHPHGFRQVAILLAALLALFLFFFIGQQLFQFSVSILHQAQQLMPPSLLLAQVQQTAMDLSHMSHCLHPSFSPSQAATQHSNSRIQLHSAPIDLSKGKPLQLHQGGLRKHRTTRQPLNLWPARYSSLVPKIQKHSKPAT